MSLVWARFMASIITLALLAAPLGAEAQQAGKVRQIGFLVGGTFSSPSVQIEPFNHFLRERGWIEGQNLKLVYRYAEGDYERLPALAHELVNLGVDVIVTDGTPPTRAAMRVTKTVPIVMATTGDPVGAALVSSLAHPGGNVTGVSFFMAEINAKRLELLKEAVPHIAHVAVVYNPLNPVDETTVEAIETIAKALKVRIERLAVRAPADFEAVFPMLLRQRVDAVTVVEDPMIQSQSSRIVEAALRGGVPAVFSLSSFVAAGGFMSYGPSRPDLWRQAALLTDKVLRGAKPGDLPVVRPTKFDLVINLKTAKALGLTIPPLLLLRADEVIQ
jgi:putative tryptophan/tyrosine transport system substrate-binding protein